MAVQPKHLLTYEDYAAFPDDGLRHEIIAGEDYILSAPNVRHQKLVVRLTVAIANHIVANGGGEVLVSPCDVLLGEHDIVQPDVIFVADVDAGIITAPNLKGAPTLVIEVLSDPRHDRIRKREVYARAGVPTYWIVEPDADRIEVYRLTEGSYPKPEILEGQDVLTIDALAGFALTVAELFS